MEIEKNKLIVKELFETQKDLDEEILKKHEISKLQLDAVQQALLDEVGELNHELKATWCWWKLTQPPVNRANVLEELVDCLHFCLIYDYTLMNDNERYYADIAYKLTLRNTKEGVEKCLRRLINSSFKMYAFIRLMHELDFTFEEVVEAYFKKNQVNHQRVREGY